ncbi:3-methylcrotonyl-CoA carboxylase alpha subunit [Novosphingobium kunmingense]|uniref:3-methylcrotonyl-CoA carboxylase alpha subunit n=1 Tax=Novosphingobium kunmingense TaxID=1211806 RepID=A0A2N0H5D8_9SPHN|nr:acetyl/propionyl/methylcrotonyl-CoA carboxylase subunit alpha [Novosphingobium kunmingense]PKB14143.1 3-methylcrotonyl-CoA carboxylase alpha subunit [Novosphingobium kunmingense]
MIESLLIANRGEIACRIIRTARAMGIRTVAVYSDADAKALHVRQADEAVHIGPSPARESYLVGEKIITAAKATNAQAIHPGYGFLSENADFAQAVIDAGLIWVGPLPESIRAMGLKDAAKERMIAAGVPVTPGYLGADQSPERLQREADAIGYPVLIKAVAGGGGKGMRRVESAGEFADALDSCRREAASSFGNTDVLIEKYILSPRHIEVQVFGDSHGNVVHLFERDCSLQRRHQKVIEEAPAPGMDAATREAICAAAVRAAKAVDYEGAGTIEFIADASDGLRADRIWFMEMNTRLQVEHPVTEEITGVDLVEWQLRVASGEPIPLKQEDLGINGWAIEARLYAEDPAKGFLPSTGPLDHLRLPSGKARIDTGVEEGAAISPFYDPMIAKVIAAGPDRAASIASLEEAVSSVEVWPVRTNAAFLARLLQDADFVAGAVDTGAIDRKLEVLTSERPISVALFKDAMDKLVLADANLGRLFSDPASIPGFRLNAPRSFNDGLYVDGHHVTDYPDNDRFSTAAYAVGGAIAIGFQDGQAHELSLARRGGGHHSAHDGDILSPMPGKVIAVEVSEGQAVIKGQKLLTLEAMKMEHTLTAPFDGTVAELSAQPGAQVQVEALLARIEASA